MFSKIILLIFVICSQKVFAQKAQKKNLVYFGGAITGNMLQVYDEDHKRIASLHSEQTFNGTIGYERIPRPLWGSIPWLRSSFEFSLAPFVTDKQKIDRVTDKKPNKGQSGIEIGTGSNGWLAYINPTLLIYLPITDYINFSFGLGLGLGYTKIKADYYITDGNVPASCASATTVASIVANCEKDKISYEKVKLSSNMLFVLSVGWFGIRVDVGSILNEVGKYEYSMSRTATTLYVQYRF